MNNIVIPAPAGTPVNINSLPGTSVFDKFNYWWKGGTTVSDGNGGFTTISKWATNSKGDDIVPGWYFGLVIFCFLLGIALAIIIGSYLNGARWINRKNGRVEGKEYVRTTFQKVAYKLLIGSLATLLLFVGYIGSIDGTLNGNKMSDADNKFKFVMLIPFFRSQGSLLYQCNIASIFILPWLMYFNKVKAVAMVAPFTFLGAATTVFSQSDLADGNGFNGFEVYRKSIEHILLMVLPLFVMVANRYNYSIKGFIGSIIYTAIFNVLVAFAVYYGWPTHFQKTLPDGTPNPDFGKEVGAGEFFEAAKFAGIKANDLAAHFWVIVIFKLGLITFALSLLLWAAYNFIFTASTNKFDTKKIKLFKFKKVLATKAKKINIKNRLKFTIPAIDFTAIAAKTIYLVRLFIFKVLRTPKMYIRNFKQVEKESWKKWTDLKTEIISK